MTWPGGSQFGNYLLRADQRRARAKRRRRRVRRFLAGGLPFTGYTPSWLAKQALLAGAVAVAGAVLVAVLLAGARLQVPFGQLWLIITTLILLQWLLAPVQEEADPGPVLEPDAPPPDPAGEPPPEQPFPQVARWERRLETTDGDPDWYAEVVRDRVRVVAAERLRRRHRVTLAADPVGAGADRAAAILGPELHGYLTAPLDRTPSPAELGQLLTKLEET